MQTMQVSGPQIHQFNNIAPKKIPRSAFKRDFTKRTTFNTNVWIPIFLDEILPGDDVNISMAAQMRLSTPLKPIMENLYFETVWFFVPNRLVWVNWEKFQGQQTNPGDSVAYTIPVLDYTKAPISTTGFTSQSIYDYMGLPTLVTGIGSSGSPGISALFNRGIDLIYNEWLRDENLTNSYTIQTGNGPDDPGIYGLRNRRKRKDYITSCLPWAQKGTPVTMPLAGMAPVIGIGKSGGNVFVNTNVSVLETGGTTPTYAHSNTLNTAGGNNSYDIQEDPNNAGFPGIFANLGAAGVTGPNLNALRQAALYQQVLELDARGGTRYVESIYTRFGVISPDFRLQRPELIGQGSTRVNVYAVPQTGGTGASGTSTPQGNLAAFGQAQITNGHSARYAATEHGMIIGLGNVRADLTYQQGIDRMFTRSTRLDFYEPLLNGLGEQAVLNNEVYAQGNSNDSAVFGYQERFSEYRYKRSEITGQFRSNDPLTLQIWHLSQSFGSLPALNDSFIEESVPMDRILAVSTSTSAAFLADFAYSYHHVRPMPVRSNPGIDIF